MRRSKSFPYYFFVLCVAAMMISGWLALSKNSDQENLQILMAGLENVLAQIRADFSTEPDYRGLELVYDDRQRNPWGEFIIISSAEDGGAGSSHIQIRLTQIPDSVCDDLLKNLPKKNFMIHVIEDGDDAVHWNPFIQENSRTCRGLNNQDKNAIQLLLRPQTG